MPFSELIPHAPQVGLFVAPSIPGDKLANALGDYAKMVDEHDVKALYDATLMGSAKDGAVFTPDRVVFQNNDLQPVHEIRYEDIVQVDARRKLLGGRRLLITVNRGRATFEVEMDFSGKPQAADYVLRFLRDAMLRPSAELPKNPGRTASTGAARASVAAHSGDSDQGGGEPGRGGSNTSQGGSDPAQGGSDPAEGDYYGAGRGKGTTDVQAVAEALHDLVNEGQLASADFKAIMELLRR